ncbi:glypican-5-like [Acomys russatus]|uniref:glypican-5-like n=1 Tax=Acomys russatus TaxID=60746 RepID=UPI0021E2D956|nr:glypican-5-like [Acomys russatus]
MLAGSLLLPGLCSSRAVPTRPRSGRTPAMLSMRSPASQPRSFRGESEALAGEASVRSRFEPQPTSATHLPSAPPALGTRQSRDHSGKDATRTPRMDARTWRLGWRCLLLLALLGSTRSEGVESCEEVRKLFQWRLGGAVKGLPDAPRAGPELQVCVSKNPTCCTRKMEERYQIAARQDLQQVLQTSSSTLKLLISRNAAAFQGRWI